MLVKATFSGKDLERVSPLAKKFKMNFHGGGGRWGEDLDEDDGGLGGGAHELREAVVREVLVAEVQHADRSRRSQQVFAAELNKN